MTTPVENHDAEQALLGALLMNPQHLERMPRLRADHFYRPAHRTVFAAVRTALERDGVVDEQVILDVLRAAGDLTTMGGGPYLHTLIAACPTVVNADYYAEAVMEASARRELESLGMRIQQAARQGDFADTSDNAARFAEEVLERCKPMTVREESVEGLHEWGRFVDEPMEPFDWVIPGLLERMDRVVVVAGEGAGKSTLARQVALCVAGGLHPFVTKQRIPRRRTLVVDLENPPRLVRRKGAHLVELLRSSKVWTDNFAYLWAQPGGIDLRRPSDVLMFDRVLGEVRPAIVCFGPLYKAFTEGGDKAETINREVAAVLDRMRAKHHIALWLEHHAPLEQQGQRMMRPVGSGVWSRWPEFGLALYRDKRRDPSGRTLRVERFRGDRDERAWPDFFEHGSPWPWAAVWNDGVPMIGETA